MRIALFSILTSIVFISPLAHSQSIDGNELKECLVKANGIHPNMIACLDSQISLANDRIQKALSVVSNDESEKKIISFLQENQAQWKRYVIGHCNIYLEFGGQRGELLQRNCIAEKTESRLQEISSMLDKAKL